MAHYKGRLVEVLLERYQNATARIACPPAALPRPGQYLQAYDPNDQLMTTPISLFPTGNVERSKNGLEVSVTLLGHIPIDWEPGAELALRGPLGRGFELPERVRRLALVALGVSPGTLLPLIPVALERGAEMAMFCDSPLRELPAAIEVRGLEAAGEAIGWADCLAVDIEQGNIDDLGQRLGIRDRLPRALTAQVLVRGQMPCGGLAKCGVCALATNKGELLACEDGPVFELRAVIGGRELDRK